MGLSEEEHAQRCCMLGYKHVHEERQDDRGRIVPYSEVRNAAV
jgi:hypothetical protein